MDLDGVLDRAGSVVDWLSGMVPVNVVLMVAVAATVMVGWWLIRKLMRLALYAAVVGVAAWLWYFGFPD